MMMSEENQNQITANKMISKQLKVKANEFLSSRKHANNLVDILQYLEESVQNKIPVTPCLLIVENIFSELLKRREMAIEIQPLKPKENSPETQYREWLQSRYKDAIRIILSCFRLEKQSDATQALATMMKLMVLEGKHPFEIQAVSTYYFPTKILKYILIGLLSEEKLNSHLINRFQEFSIYQDVVYHSWKCLPGLTPKVPNTNETFIRNYLDVINAIPVKDFGQNQQLLCDNLGKDQIELDYATVRKCINKCWNCVMHWQHKETTHRQLLIVLLERVLPHIDKPILLTDFLMDSLDLGGAIGLLALQGVFILIQQHNLTYPFVYEKLYSMFEPEIFHSKFKARLFYLADLFLSSSHLPENLVAAFVKRLARLTLVAPPQDIIVSLYFVGNLIIRHPGLKRLICHPNSGEVSRDPFIMDEREPTKSNALESSLWEIATLQCHALPTIATAAKFISNPLPAKEWNLSEVLEVTEDDIFSKALVETTKSFHLTFEKPTSMYLPRGDKMMHFWKLF